MKLRILALTALPLLTLSSLPAATVTVQNGNGPVFTSSVVDSTGAFINNGEVAMGMFSTLSDSELSANRTTVSGLIADFTEFGDAARAPIGTASGIQGVFSVQNTGSINVTSDTRFNGQDIYILGGNAATLESSSEVFVFRVNAQYPGTEPSTPTYILGTSGGTTSGTALIGGFGDFTGNPITGGPGSNMFFNTVAPIPEPSSSILLGLAGAALLLRRRRR